MYGAGVYIRQGFTVRNCLIAHNRGTGNGAGVYLASGTYTGYVQSCTIVSNYGGGNSGGIAVIGSAICSISNTIVCSNIGATAGRYDIDIGNSALTNWFYNSCCKTVALPPAQGNIQSDPLFVDFTNGNFRLNNGSPSINAGANQSWMNGAVDLDSHSRIDRPSGKVDIGCYEYIPPITLVTIPGLQ
jgi:hypothetical protein